MEEICKNPRDAAFTLTFSKKKMKRAVFDNAHGETNGQTGKYTSTFENPYRLLTSRGFDKRKSPQSLEKSIQNLEKYKLAPICLFV